MSYADFVHLRVHTAYSLSEGAIRNKELASLCRDQAMPAVAMTDTNNIYGAFEFSGGLSSAGVQPIIGCQLSVSRVDGNDGGVAQSPDQLVLLVQNTEGYHNLLKLVGKAYMDSEDVAEPQVSLESIYAHAGGLIALTGGIKGSIGRLLVDGQGEAAEGVVTAMAEAFAGRLYMEIQRHGLPDEKKVEAALVDMAYAHDIPLVATNEAFFSSADMYDAHDALLCIAGGAYVAQSDRRRLTAEHGFKSPKEMRRLFADLPEAVDNTVVIAKRCAFMVEKIDPILPPFDCGEGRTEKDELREQSKAGLQRRIDKQVYTDGASDDEKEALAKPYWERLDFELGVIEQMGFPGYFLIVAEFIQWAKDHGIPVGPGRGSGAGSVVAWALTITDLDPLRFSLLFERFLNPERVSMPDFDVDFCQDRRDEVIKHVQDKYGRDRVAQIITFGKLQAKAVVRDVGRVLEMPYGYIDKISKMIPMDGAQPCTLEQSLEMEPDLRRMMKEDPDVANLIKIGLQLEGLYRHASTHAAGVVIGDRPLDDLIPLYRDPRSDMPVTGFNMKYVEDAGLVKFDFLGLKTLTVLQTAVNYVKTTTGTDIDLTTIPLDDPPTFRLLERADTVGVFQLESAGMRDVLRKLKPDTFEDIIAVVALYRPGPMDNIPSYIARKHGEEEPDYLYPSLETILKETFGIIIYQEQVMQIAQELSGYSLGGADLLRRAMGKKIAAEMEQQRAIFVDGAEAKGVARQKASDIFDLVAKFASYGFNKSHAAAYALVAYQTAYMKANYPVEFLAASMTLDLTNTDKLNVFRQELDRMKVPLRIPNINASEATFKVEVDGDVKAIRYALAAVKNVGESAMDAVVAERRENGPFEDIDDFTNRLDTKQVNKRQLENLVRAGAFDEINANRRQLYDGIETILRHASVAASERNSDQIGLFGGETAVETPGVELPKIADWPPMDRLKEEFDAVGFYLSAHPLDAYGKSLGRLGVVEVAEVMDLGRSGPVDMAGTVIGKKERTSQKGNRYAFVQLSDSTGVFEITVFSEQLAQAREVLEVGNSVHIKGSVQFEGETARFTAHGIQPLDKVASGANAGLKIRLDDDTALAALAETLSRHNGGGPGAKGKIALEVRTQDGKKVKIKLAGGYAINPNSMSEVRAIAGLAGVEEL